jgi:quercetin dioxygenase-like cupin family protein
MNAFKLFTGSDNASHLTTGTLASDQRTDAVAVHFKESPPHSAFDWHEAPERQYVITLAGTLEFTTRDGEKCITRPGDVLVAADTVGSGQNGG